MILSEINRDEMIEKNIGLVHSCAHKFSGKGIEYDDLFQAGCIGLIKAVDNFKEDLGFSFSTYAVPVILGEIKRLFRDGGTVSVSRSIKEKGRKIAYERDKFVKEFDREPTVGELSEMLGYNEFETAQAIAASMPVLSLTVSDDDSDSQFDIPVPDHEESVSMNLAVHQVIDRLDERDRELIKQRYFAGKTQTQTAESLGMTQVQVSRREKQILKYMKSKLI
ncbi:MAG: sigma-70 family RNA polymerase sigma factor [Acutalibacteraceae bacterium]